VWIGPDFGKIYNVKRFRRWMFNGLAALSLLLFVALVADRAFVPHQLSVVRPPPPTMTTTVVNGVWIFSFHDSAVSRIRPFVHILGWRIPVTTAFILTVTLPVCWIAMRCRERWVARRAPGFCARCGHDLRATPGRCPECGTIPTKRGSISTSTNNA
jgi:hypothetical protein